MAKKRTKITPAGQLGDWLEDVHGAADAYDKAHTSKTKSQGKLNTAKDTLIEKMRFNKVEKVRIRNGAKILIVSATDKITYEKPEEIPAA